MVIYGVFPNSKPGATARPARPHSAPEKKAPEPKRTPYVPQAANDSSAGSSSGDSGEPAGPSLTRRLLADWWPLAVAGIVIALMI